MDNLTYDDIIFAFDLTPDKALEFFKKKGIEMSEDYLASMKIAYEQGFTITKVMDMDILNDFKSILEKAIEDGMTVDEFKLSIKEKLSEKGWLGRVISDVPGQEKIDTPWRLNLIFRQNLTSAYADGRNAKIKSTVKTFPFVLQNSTLDPSTTSNCNALDNKVFKVSDAFYQSILRPPGHFGCRRREDSLDQETVDSLGLRVSSSSTFTQFRNSQGFEHPATGVWQPDLSVYPKELVNQF